MKISRDKNYKFFTDCIIVKGVRRAIVIDTTRGNFHFIPITLADLIAQNPIINYNRILKKINLEHIDVLNEYFDFLIHNEFLFECDKHEISQFPDISIDWMLPSIIYNAVIDSPENFIDSDLVSQLSNMNCRHIQLRFFSNINNVSIIKELLMGFENSTIMTIDLFFNEGKVPTYKELKSYYELSKRLNNIIIFGSKKNSSIQMKNNFTTGFINYLSQKNYNELSCGNISQNYLAYNLKHFTEAQQHNTCLNRKISIDKNGYIKNCPSMAHHFGHISEVKLEDVVKNPEFTKYWTIKKDDITKCKDCEFRYICTDCRAYIENPNDLHSAPLKCGYNPYTCEWETWSTNPLKQQTAQKYGIPID